MKFESPIARLPLFADFDASFPEQYRWVNLEPREGGWPEWLWAQNQSIILEHEAKELFPDSTNQTPLPRRILLVGQNSNDEDILDDSDRPAR